MPMHLLEVARDIATLMILLSFNELRTVYTSASILEAVSGFRNRHPSLGHGLTREMHFPMAPQLTCLEIRIFG